MRNAVPWIGLSVLCAVLFVVGIGSTPLIGLDEALYAESAREMSASGNWIVPTYNATPLFDKPPLCYWLMGTCMEVLGPNSLAARLPSALAGLALVALTCFVTLRIYGRRPAILAGFILASTIMTVALARMAVMDMLFSLCITASLAAFLLSYLKLWPRTGYLAFWAAHGVSMLIKGPAGAVLIISTVIAFLAIRRKLGILLEAMPIPGLILMFVIAAPWYALVQKATDGTFLWQFFVHQNLQRALGQDFHHNMPFFFYLPVYFIGFFPWSVFVPVAWKNQVKLHPKDAEQEASLFAAVWMIVIVAIFSISKSKLPAYIYPMYPASAILVGVMWSRMVGEMGERLRKHTAVAAILPALLFLAITFGPFSAKLLGLAPVLTIMSAALLVGSVGACERAKARSPRWAFTWLVVGNVGFLLVAAFLGLPEVTNERSMPGVQLSAKIRQVVKADEAVFSYQLSPQQYALPFYSRRPVIPTKTADELVDAMCEKACLVVAQKDRLEGLPEGGKPVVKSGPYVVYRFEK